MKELVKNSASTFLRIVVVNVMCLFVVISISVLLTAVFTKNIGYSAMGTSSDSSGQTKLYTHYYSDGEDTKKAEFEEQGYTITQTKIRSDITRAGMITFLIISQVFCLIILISFIYPIIWHIGTKDSNLVKFKHKKEDKLKGLKIGFMALIPAAIFFIFLIVAKLGALTNFPMIIYKLANSSLYSLIDVVVGKALTVGDVSVFRFILLIVVQLIIPLICMTAYMLGYKNYSIYEKIIYKKK